MHARMHCTREPGDPTAVCRARQTATESPRTRAGDERPWEVGRGRSTCEALERSHNRGGGEGGGKEPDRGELVQEQHVPSAVSGRRAQRSGTSATSCKEGQETEVHHASAPRLQRRRSQGRVLCFTQRRERWNRRGDMGTLRSGARAESRGSRRKVAARGVPSEARQARVHPQARWSTTADRGADAGGQDRPASGRAGAQRDLRGGLRRVFVRVPTTAQPASSAGRARRRNHA
jgi:hypothetical protein